jgi:DNA replication protein DnaC/transposase
VTIPPEHEAEIRRLYHIEKWKVGTIATQLRVHRDVVQRVVQSDGTVRARPSRPSRIDPYLPFVQDTLGRYPRIPASRIYDMCKERGYRGSPDHFRHMIARYRPLPAAEAYQRLSTLPGEQAQVDWAHFGRVQVGRAVRALLAFVIVLSYSRQVFLRFFYGQHAENFLRGHEAAFSAWQGVARIILYDNLKSAVLDRRGDAIHFNPLLLEFANHYHFQPRAAAPARGNEKGRVERAIRFVRTSFWPARRWDGLDDLNSQAEQWCVERAAERPWPDDHRKTVAEVFAEEKSNLLALPDDDFATEERREVKVGKTPYARFDGNDYSVPHTLVRRTLEVRASLECVRVLSAGEVVAVHTRSFDRGQLIEDPSHVEALRIAKAESREHRAMDRLTRSAPSSQALFVRLAERGENIGRQTQLVLSLLTEYGGIRLEQAYATWRFRRMSSTATTTCSVLTRMMKSRRAIPMPTKSDEKRHEQARQLGLWGLLAHWDEYGGEPWVERLLEYEEEERQRRSLERRIHNAKLGRFKPLADFEWGWPKSIDRDLIDDVLRLDFLDEAANVVVIGPNGVGKSTIAQNIGYQALLAGYSVRRVTASEMLNDLAAQDSSAALARRLRRYCNPSLLIVDEIGYLAFDSRYGDLLFEVVSRRHETKSIVLTTNKPFSEWNDVFPNASCVTALVDRLVHKAEIVKIDGASYRAKEARERTAKRTSARKAKRRRSAKKTRS